MQKDARSEPNLRFECVGVILGVESVFSKTDCDRALVEDTVGSSTGIRDSNILSYLALLEQKATELLAMQAFINSKVQKDK